MARHLKIHTLYRHIALDTYMTGEEWYFTDSQRVANGLPSLNIADFREVYVDNFTDESIL